MSCADVDGSFAVVCVATIALGLDKYEPVYR